CLDLFGPLANVPFEQVELLSDPLLVLIYQHITMMANLGSITIPDYAPAALFPLSRVEYGFAASQQPTIAVHEFATISRKIQQRFVMGNGARKFTIGYSRLTSVERQQLESFWDSLGGAWKPFWFDEPAPDGSTTRLTCVFDDPTLTFEALADCLCSCTLPLAVVPDTVPEYTIADTVNRFPTAALNDNLLEQTQTIIPIIKIMPLGSSTPIYVSDRHVTIGGVEYQPRLLDWDGIGQSLGDLGSDEASFTFGNADRAFTELVNATDLFRAHIEFSLFHVDSLTKLDLWAGDITDWQCGDGQPEFKVNASDGLYELRLNYPNRKILRTCWRMPGSSCPLAAGTQCDKTWDACLAHEKTTYFGGILANPQTVTSKDNSTGTWGIGRETITSRSLIADSIFGLPLPQVYTEPS